MMITNKRKEILKKVITKITKYDDEVRERKAKNKSSDDDFKKYRECMRKIMRRGF